VQPHRAVSFEQIRHWPNSSLDHGTKPASERC
jgi:hypothetical protein